MMRKILASALRIYRKNLAQYFIFRLFREIGLFGYRLIYRLSCRIRGGLPISTYEFVSFSEFQRRAKPRTISIAPAEHLVLPPPQIVGAPSVVADMVGSIDIDAPKSEIVEIPDATVVGGSGFVLARGFAIHSDLYVPNSEESPAEIRGRILVNSDRTRMTSYFGHGPRHVPRAVNLLGQSAANYAHWMTEIVPKLAVLDASSEYDDWPLLVDGWIHRNMWDSISLLARKPREIILVDRWQPVSLNVVVEVSATGYEPYIPHKLSNRPHPKYKNRFSRFALEAVRNAAQRAPLEPSDAGATRVYMRRGTGSSNVRGLSNALQIEHLMRDNGFRIVDPGQLSFSEQVDVCRQAEVIAAPVGASLANMIFAPAGAKIVALAPFYENDNYYYYAVLAGVLGHKLLFVLGEPSSRRAHPIHNDYEIDAEILGETLKNGL